MGPKYGVVGNSLEHELPVTQVADNDLAEEKKATKFSRTAEFKKLKQHLEERIEFYQKWLPNGSTILESTMTPAELGARWQVANAVIAEFKLIIDAYEQAREVVENAIRRSDS